MNGCRVTDTLFSLVNNIENFKLALRMIKLWAEKRGIYSNVFGYLGGVSWAILMTYVCQLYPDALPPVLIEKFFFIYSRWNWSEKPVKLVQKIDLQVFFVPKQKQFLFFFNFFLFYIIKIV